MKKPLIFISNDDGYQARGLAALVETASKFGRVVAVVPETAQSGMSHAITMGSPLFLRTISESDDVKIYACCGTPVDCVKIAFDMLLEETPSLALSGINHGSNSAINVIYSGTMGAARECSFYNVPSIGFSLLNHSEDADFTAAKHFASIVIDRVMTSEIEVPLCLNVNIPDLPREQIKGIRLCRQNRGYWTEEFERRSDPRGRDYFWLKGSFHNMEQNSTDTDEYALKQGYVSMVPIQTDMTDYRQLEELRIES